MFSMIYADAFLDLPLFLMHSLGGGIIRSRVNNQSAFATCRRSCLALPRILSQRHRSLNNECRAERLHKIDVRILVFVRRICAELAHFI